VDCFCVDYSEAFAMKGYQNISSLSDHKTNFGKCKKSTRGIQVMGYYVVVIIHARNGVLKT
jgi:hypothetical protein